MRFLLLLAMALACGGPESESYKAPDPAGSSDDSLVSRECGRCHNGSRHPRLIRTVGELKASNAKRRVESGTMPPDRSLASDVKARLISLF